MEVRRNARFDLAQNVEILFNPIAKLESGKMSGWLTRGEYENFIAYWSYDLVGDALTVNDVFATKFFGGRIAEITDKQTNIGVSYDTFAEEGTSYIKGYVTTDAYVFSRKNGTVTNEYFYDIDGVGYIQESGGGEAGDNNRILGGFITERSLTVNNGKFGYGYQKYNNSWVDKIKIAIPANIEEWKLTQMLNSMAVAVKGCNELYTDLPIEGVYDSAYDDAYEIDGLTGSSDWDLIEGYNYYTQYTGGSCSPVIRLVNMDRTTLAFNKRRNVFEIEAIILG